MKSSRSSAIGALLALAVLGGNSDPAWGQTEKVFGEATADQALVYLIWPNKGRYKGQVHLDDRVLWQTKGNSYGFAHIDPGLHWIWGYRPVQMEFVPGQTYYVLVLSGLSTLSSEEGQQYIENVKHYVPSPTPQDIAADSKRAKKWFPKLLAQLRESGRIEIDEIPPPSKPAETDQLIRVPQHAPLELVLTQTVTTVKNFSGDRVWFRVAEDAEVDGQVWLPAGTPVEGTIVFAEGARRGGVGGHFEIVIPAVTTGDGTTVPLISRFASAGRPRSVKGAAAFGLVGLAFAAKKGREGYETAGTRWPAWTRFEVWVRPPVEAARTPGSPAPSIQVCQARPVTSAELSLAPESRNWPGESKAGSPVNPTEIEILVELEDEIRSLEFARVGDWRLPDPLEPVRFAEHGDGQSAVFDGWGLLRHLRPEENVEVRFEGILSDGTPLTCEASLRMSVEVAGKK